MRAFAAAIAATLAFAAPANATNVFFDNFDNENGGASQFNYTNFANFTVTGGGAPDIIASGSFFNCPGPGSCVDLDGTPGPATLTSIASFAFNAGDTIRLSFDLGGNQRPNSDPGPDDWFAGFDFSGSTQMLNYGFNYFGSDTVVFADVTTTAVSTSTNILATSPFLTRSIFFTAGNAGTLTFSIGTGSGDNFGPILDNVSLDIAAVPEPATWAMMIAGFGLVGGMMRRRKTAAQATA